MSEADVPYALAIGLVACLIGGIWGFIAARKSNKKPDTSTAASIDNLGEEISRTRGAYKDYRDTVDGEFGDINSSVSRLNAAYAALLNNFVSDAEKLAPDNEYALKIAANDRDLISTGKKPDTTTSGEDATRSA